MEKIQVKIISSRASEGPKIIEGTPEEIYSVIKNHMRDKKQWFYRDGKMVGGEFTPESLKEASNLTLTNGLVGG